MRFAATGLAAYTNWWAMAPGAVTAMLDRLGFSDARVSTHRQLHHMGHDMSQPATEIEMFTVTARRR